MRHLAGAGIPLGLASCRAHQGYQHPLGDSSRPTSSHCKLNCSVRFGEQAQQPLAQDGAAQAGRRDPTAAGRDAEARPAPGCCRPGRAGPRSCYGSSAAAHLPRPAVHQPRGAAGLRGRPQPYGRRLGVHRAGGAPRCCRGCRTQSGAGGAEPRCARGAWRGVVGPRRDFRGWENRAYVGVGEL